MDFAYSDEQQMLRSSAADWLRGRYPADRLAAIADSEDGIDSVWKELGALGWLGLSVPESLGGAGYGFLEESVVIEEAGAALLPSPLVSTLIALPLLTADQQSSVAEGQLSATVAWDPVDISTDAAGGTVRYVPDAAVSGVILVVQGDTVAEVDRTAATVTPLHSTDGLRRLADVTLGAPLTTRGDLTAADVRSARTRAYAAVACEAVGVARAAYEMAKRQASEREQFGRVIGTYQAVSHQVADIYTRLELSRSLATWASWAVSVGDESAPRAALAAKSFAADSAVLACERSIQVHGGIGFTWDHVLHRYYKRAQQLAAFGGRSTQQRAQIAAALLDSPGSAA